MTDNAQTTTEPPFWENLPGDLMMWVMIVSELLIFGAGLAVFLFLRLMDPAGFAEAQTYLHRTGAGIGTVVLVTSGWLAAVAAHSTDRIWRCRALLAGATLLGAVFMGIKGQEWADLFAQGISFETHVFFTFSFMLTGFHAAHVIAGMLLLAFVAIRPNPRSVEVGAAFWHMVDLVWILVFPVVYLL
ncbi:cytochrome c oxidase subunit 3 [Pseudorhodobacter aquimaris]|uniref:cytochrome c oxidase subunit 3 n=1 Tax=Pseudorhodobacter aquimaris TaxID=687412 RepID=UPI00067D58EF|nr:cytochrome c oxidase subunit 3 [Pseudorhodobacter aquimaris]